MSVLKIALILQFDGHWKFGEIWDDIVFIVLAIAHTPLFFHYRACWNSSKVE